MNSFFHDLSLFSQNYLLQSLCETNRKQHTQPAQLCGKEQQMIQQAITKLSENILNRYSHEQEITVKAESLIVVMDAREVCNTEKQLQQALTLAEQLLPQMPASPLKCKLLSYCYYYVEEPECANEASRIIENWDKTQYTAEMQEAVQCYQNLTSFLT